VVIAGAVYVIAGMVFSSVQPWSVQPWSVQPWSVQRWAAGFFMAAMAFGSGAFLVAGARGVAQAKAWTRGPLLVWQLLQAAAVWSSAQTLSWLVVGTLGVSAVVAVGLFRPGVLTLRSGDAWSEDAR
jgi:hypothetical protein